VGQRYAATVRKMMDYGAFVELGGTGGTQALLHISELDAGRVSGCPNAVKVP
jgi:predicted RNA-binding protein with RPS1 domain